FPPIGVVIEHVVDGDERHTGLACDRRAPEEPCAVIAAIEHVGGEPHAAAGGVAQEREEIACARFFLRTCDQPKRGLWLGLRRGGGGEGGRRGGGGVPGRRRGKVPCRGLHH